MKNKRGLHEIPVSIVVGTSPNVVKRTDLQYVWDKVNTKDPKLKRKAKELQRLKEEDVNRYTIEKNKLEAFIIGNFQKRNDKGCTDYIPLLVFDVDGISSPFIAATYIEDCRASDYVYLAFPSPSGRGLRLLVWSDSTKENHKIAYNQIVGYLSHFLGIKTDKEVSKELKAQGLSNQEVRVRLKEIEHLDTSTSNVSRHWYFAAVEPHLICFNEDSKAYVTTKQLEPPSPPKPTLVAPRPVNRSENLSEHQKMILIKAIVDSRNKGGRNVNIFHVACLSYEYGISEQVIFSECGKIQSESSDHTFTESELRKTVLSAKKEISEKGNIGKYKDKQLLVYANKLLGSYQKVNELIGRTLPNQAQDKTTDKTINETTGIAQTQHTNKAVNDTGTTTGLFYDYEGNLTRLREIKIQLTKDLKIKSKDFKFPKIMIFKAYLNSKYDFRLNTLSNEVEYKAKDGTTFELLNEHDLISELMELGFTGVGTPLESLLNSSFVPRYDPITDYCKNLPKWKKGDPDYVTQLANYVKAKEQDWFNIQFKKMLVRTLACGLGRIPFNKQCFTFLGKQNDGKSTFVRFLCPPTLQHYFSEDIEYHNKDGRIALATNFIINFDDLDTLPRKDIAAIKKYMTTSKIKVRLPFAKKATPMERRVSFFATTNEAEILTDTTGNVRWLIMPIDGIQHDDGGKLGYNQNINIDLVYSQAYTLLKSGFNYKITGEEMRKSETNNKGFQVQTIEMDLVQLHLEPSDILKGEHLTTTEIVDYLTEKTSSKISSYKLGHALRFLGFERKSIRKEKRKNPVTGYWVNKIA